MPLLIGGATCSRVHTAVKIAPHYRARWSMCPTPRAAWAWRKGCCLTQARQVHRRLNTDYDKVREQHANKKANAAVDAGAGARQQDADRLVATTFPPRPSSLAAACSRTTTWPKSRNTSTGARSSRPGIWPAPFPAILTTKSWANRRAKVLSRRPSACCKKSSTAAGSPPMPCWAVPRQHGE
jgi:hypothetical protein